MDLRSDLLTVAFVSGKGGVGKTMLTAAFAKEISSSNKTLIIDLDFFNRGITGLLGEGEARYPVPIPGFLASTAKAGPDTQWYLAQVDENILHVAYPPLTHEQTRLFEGSSLDQLKDSLTQWISEVARIAEVSCVVLDCHGGPDNSSFAACLIASRTYLVSEPDRITFFGTVNFVRTLSSLADLSQIDLQLIFNKVISDFSAFYLTNFYNREVRDYFGGRPLAGIFPLEAYLTKAFEKTAFLTYVYPHSLLARKTRLLILDLLHKRCDRALNVRWDRVKTPDSVRVMPWWQRTWTKYSLGKTFFLLDWNFVSATIVAIMVAAGAVETAWNLVYKPQYDSWRSQIESDRVFLLIYIGGAHKNKESDRPIYRIPEESGREMLIHGMQLCLDERSTDTTKCVYDLSRTLYPGLPDAGKKLLLPKEPRPRTNIDAFIRTEIVRVRENDVRAKDGDFFEEFGSALHDGRGEQYLRKQIPTEKWHRIVANLEDLGLKPHFNLAIQSMKSQSTVIKMRRVRDWENDVLKNSLPLVFGWFCATLLLDWTRKLDRAFTYNSRRGKPLVAFGIMVALAALWVFPVGLLSVFLMELGKSGTMDWFDIVSFFGVSIGLGFLLTLLLWQLYETYLTIKLKGELLEIVVRPAFVLLMLSIGIWTLFYLE